ncbi:hypothetical protein [Trueperella pyogenes]|uniref:hypothetical protein n=1 Tax=Trueperella pyogenes TaxID=1661 RepID=UPI000C1B7A67|nr:hypothetical protein [Trueperella pyogenes]PIN51831.1 hypothetical protein CT171_04640 [Trueperella pyogenes]
MKVDAQLWQLAAIVSALIAGFGTGLAGDKTNWHEYAQTMVDARNTALVSRDWQALAQLTAAGSPAREEDEKLKSWLQARDIRIQAMSTQVIAADVVDRHGPILAVISHQSGAHIRGSASANEGQRMCRLWRMKEGKIFDVTPCTETPAPPEDPVAGSHSSASLTSAK